MDRAVTAERRPYSEETARAIDEEVSRIIDESHDEARRLLTEHRKELEALAQALLERETLDEEEILEVTGLPPAPPAGEHEDCCLELELPPSRDIGNSQIHDRRLASWATRIRSPSWAVK